VQKSHACQGAAGEHRQDPANPGGGLIHKLLQCNGVNPGNWNVSPDAIDDQQTDCEKYALAQFGRLAQCAPT